MEAREGDGILPTWKGARGTVQPGGCPTIMCTPDTVYSQSGCAPSLITGSHIGHCIWILEEEDEDEEG